MESNMIGLQVLKAHDPEANGSIWVAEGPEKPFKCVAGRGAYQDMVLEHEELLSAEEYRYVDVEETAPIGPGQHINVNVMTREDLVEAMEDPTKHPQLTVRVSGYAVRFNSLTKEQQLDLINRTFTESI